jgi:hypothetical protein
MIVALMMISEKRLFSRHFVATDMMQWLRSPMQFISRVTCDHSSWIALIKLVQHALHILQTLARDVLGAWSIVEHFD